MCFLQALLATGTYRFDFDLSAAIKFIIQEAKGIYPNIQDIYYMLPIFSSTSLTNISSDHCVTPVKTGKMHFYHMPQTRFYIN